MDNQVFFAPLRGMRVAGTVACVLLCAASVNTAPRPIQVAAEARVVAPGELVVLTLTASTAADRVSVRAFDREIATVRIDTHTWRALVGIDLDVAPGTHTVWINEHLDGNGIETTHDLIVRSRQFATRRLQVDPSYVDLPAAVLERVFQETAELKRVWGDSAAERLWEEPFVQPVAARANSSFGSRSIFNGKLRNPHTGTDFSSRAGTLVKAPNAGRIVFVRDLYFSGNTLMIDHGLGLISLFAHLSAFMVREGEVVSRGQTVGLVGATGRVTGPHLHWAVRANGSRIDPLSLLALLGR